MLIHHFEAEIQNFQVLVDQNERGKALVPENPRQPAFRKLYQMN